MWFNFPRDWRYPEKLATNCIRSVISLDVALMLILAAELLLIAVKTLLMLCNLFWKLVKIIIFELLIVKFRVNTFCRRLFAANFKRFCAWLIINFCSGLNDVTSVEKLSICNMASYRVSLLLIRFTS